MIESMTLSQKKKRENHQNGWACQIVEWVRTEMNQVSTFLCKNQKKKQLKRNKVVEERKSVKEDNLMPSQKHVLSFHVGCFPMNRNYDEDSEGQRNWRGFSREGWRFSVRRSRNTKKRAKWQKLKIRNVPKNRTYRTEIQALGKM